jgi:hypothetical protein
MVPRRGRTPLSSGCTTSFCISKDRIVWHRLALDLTPTNAQLAGLLGQSQLAATLARDGRLGGSYRVFTFVAPEPSVYNVTLHAVIELDAFPDAARAADWLSARAPTLANVGSVVAVAAPGHNPVVRSHTTTAGDLAATTTVLTLRAGNVAMEITTVFVGQGPSIADAERYVALIIDRLTHSGSSSRA